MHDNIVDVIVKDIFGVTECLFCAGEFCWLCCVHEGFLP